MDAIWGALVLAAVTGLLALMGKRVESGTSRAVEAQGAAAESWQELAVFHKDRGDALDQVLKDDRALAATRIAALEAQIRGLENRLAAAGEPIRSAPQPLDEPRRARQPVPEGS